MSGRPIQPPSPFVCPALPAIPKSCRLRQSPRRIGSAVRFVGSLETKGFGGLESPPSFVVRPGFMISLPESLQDVYPPMNPINGQRVPERAFLRSKDRMVGVLAEYGRICGTFLVVWQISHQFSHRGRRYP